MQQVVAAPVVVPSPRWAVIGALLVVYLVWGSTYFALKVALETIPPFLVAGPRYLAAGAALYAFLRFRGAPAPTRQEWIDSAKVGALLLVGGNGGVALAQRSVSSSVAAVVVATMPIWAALFAALSSARERPTRREVLGLALGFGGIALLHAGGSIHLDAAGAFIVLAPICWALGSVWSRRLALPAGGMATAAQMLTGGAMMLAIGLARGERLHHLPSGRSLSAVVYLVVMGSIVAFSAYTWLLRNVRPAVAMSYAFVNPLVALGLGVLVAGEPFSVLTGLAVATSLLGVGVILRPR